MDWEEHLIKQRTDNAEVDERAEFEKLSSQLIKIAADLLTGEWISHHREDMPPTINQKFMQQLLKDSNHRGRLSRELKGISDALRPAKPAAIRLDKDQQAAMHSALKKSGTITSGPKVKPAAVSVENSAMIIDMKKSRIFLKKDHLPYQEGESYIKNCVIIARNNEQPFYLDKKTAQVFLDGYAIIPIEYYEALLSPEFYNEADIHKMAIDMKNALEAENTIKPAPNYAGVDNAAYSTNDRAKAADSALSPASNEQPVELPPSANCRAAFEKWNNTTDSHLEHNRWIAWKAAWDYLDIDGVNRQLLWSAQEVERLRKWEYGWQLIETAPKDGEILGFGSYLYPGDKDRTTYHMLIEWDRDSWCSYEGNHADGFFTHWQELTKPIDIEGQS